MGSKITDDLLGIDPPTLPEPPAPPPPPTMNQDETADAAAKAQAKVKKRLTAKDVLFATSGSGNMTPRGDTSVVPLARKALLGK